MVRLFVTLVVVLTAVVMVSAQALPTSWTLRVYPAGSATQVGTPLVVQAVNVPCDLAPVTGSNINPTRWRWTDPARPTRECEWPDASRLTALPDGNYEGTISAANADGSSAETARIPFERRRPQPPSVPTGAKLIQ